MAKKAPEDAIKKIDEEVAKMNTDGKSAEISHTHNIEPLETQTNSLAEHLKKIDRKMNPPFIDQMKIGYKNFFLVAGLGVGSSLLTGAALMFGWNASVSTYFGWPVITYLQGVGLSAIVITIRLLWRF